MKTSQHHPNSAAEEQASLWAARLDGDRLNDSQRAELDAWLAEDPAHRALLSQYCQLSADLEEQVPALVAAGVVTLPVTEAPAPRKSRWTFPRLSALTLAAAAAVAVTFVTLKPAPSETFATAPGRRETYVLADGSRVELNANTSLRFVNSGKDRRVQLGGGEALFMVTKDPSRPFIVETPAGSVRVTGTTFNVRSEPTATAFEVTVVEGSVQVRSSVAGAKPSADVPLVAGDQFVARPDGQTKRNLSEAQLEDTLAWRRGHAVFIGTPLREAAARYARYHGKTILVDPDVAEERVGGQYSIDDLPAFLIGVERTLSVQRRSDPNGTVIILERRAP